ncbi:MAG TPA: prepilin-type N-terminal cleavage/methylation domain-containing protein [Candidatus Limnocylindria bacterium]|jgi:prepilin-type N-terminal cleavage/methylation domain-containing protein|nr:prepilin-type N-terminal cleavage/methylation domain-containing protein [Candidatus Limnocylindria bacterium]
MKVSVRNSLETSIQRRQKAFTLIEVLIAIFVFVLVLSSVYGTWKLVTQGSKSALKAASDGQRTKMTTAVLDEALSSAVFFTQNAKHYALIADTSGPYGAITFVSSLSDSFPGSGAFGGERVRRVTFSVDPGHRDLLLEQSSMLADLTQSEPQRMVLAHDVETFQLEFWDNRLGDYITEWTQTNQLPLLVRVSLGFGSARGLDTKPREMVTRTIRLASVGVPREAQGGQGIR